MGKNDKRRVLIVGPSQIVAAGLSSILEESDLYHVVGVIEQMDSCGERIKVRQPDVVVIDPVVLGYGRRIDLYARYPYLSEVVTVALAGGYVDEQTLTQLDGTIGLYDEAAQIVRKVGNAVRASSEAARSKRPADNDLSAREREILVAVAQGLMNKEIADRCHISVNTVMTHRKSITRKTGIKTVAGLTVYALLNNYIRQEEL